MQRRRLFFQLGFFALFLLAPALNLLRFDLHEAQLWVLGQRWSLGIDAFRAGEISANQAAIQIFVRAFLPAIVLIAAFLGVAWKYGRLYCGWLCPHFTLVETLNTALHRACGKLSIWDQHRTRRAGVQPSARWWPVFFTLCAVFGFLWAITLLTYLLPPAEIWGGLFSGTLTPNQARFLGAGSLIFTLEFAFARHLFCRFGCAVGLFQSLVWMANPKGGGGLRPRPRARLPHLHHRHLPAGFCLRQRLPHAAAPSQHQTHDVLVRAVRSVPGFV
jgi:polyferredoxin